MTTPGGVPNLPAGALTLDNIYEALHDMSPAAMRGRVNERMPDIFHTSMGGNPASDSSFFGFLTQLWAGFNSAVANADPADITGPDDLPGLLVHFIEDLPIIGDLVRLMESLAHGELDVAEVLAAIENVFNTIGSMLGLTAPVSLAALTAAQTSDSSGASFDSPPLQMFFANHLITLLTAFNDAMLGADWSTPTGITAIYNALVTVLIGIKNWLLEIVETLLGLTMPDVWNNLAAALDTQGIKDAVNNLKDAWAAIDWASWSHTPQSLYQAWIAFWNFLKDGTNWLITITTNLIGVNANDAFAAFDLPGLTAAAKDLQTAWATIDWTDWPEIPADLYEAWIAFWNFAKDITNWAIAVIANLTNGLIDLRNAFAAFDLADLTAAVNNLQTAWGAIDWADWTETPANLHAAWMAFWDFAKALVDWAITVVTNLTGGLIDLRHAFAAFDLPELRAAWDRLVTAMQAIDWLSPDGWFQALTAVVHFASDVVTWALKVIVNIGSLDFTGLWAALGLTTLCTVLSEYAASLSAVNWTLTGSWAPTGALWQFVDATLKLLQGVGNWILGLFASLLGIPTDAIHGIFTSLANFITAAIGYTFGDAATTAWQDALNLITGITGATPSQAIAAIYHQFQDVLAMFGNPLGIGGSGFDPIAAIETFVQDMVQPTNLLAPLEQLTTGVFTIPTINIPGLDASAIISGVFPQSMVNNLTSDLAALNTAITTGNFQPLIDAILHSVGIPTGTGLTADVQTYFNSLAAMLGTPALTSGTFNASTAVSNFISSMVNPLNMLAKLVSNLVPVGNIPGLDASKITSGAFATSMVTNLTGYLTNLSTGGVLSLAGLASGALPAGVTAAIANVTNLGGYLTNLNTSGILSLTGLASGALPAGVTAAIANVTNLGSYLTNLNLSGIYGGSLTALQIPVLDASKITSGQFAQSMLNITSIAAGIVSGVLGTGNIPNLPASQITSGTFGTGLIPGLDASKITSGQFAQSMVNITSIAAGIISGVLGTGNIPSLDAGKITTGTFGTTLIPNLDAAKITSGQFAQSMVNITSIAAGIISGTLGTGQIPSLDASKITSGAFAAAQIPQITAAMATALLPQALWQQSAVAGNNLVLSPGFEDSTVVRYTGSYGTNANAVFDYSTAQAHGGTRSYSIQTATDLAAQNQWDVLMLPNNNYGTDLFAQMVKAQPGQWFYCEIYVRAKSTNTTTAGLVYFGMLFALASSGGSTQTAVWAQAANVTAISTTGWTKLSGWVQAPAGYDLACVHIGFQQQNVGAQTYYIDDARCVENTQAQTLVNQLFGGNNILSAITAGNVPGIDASKIISGVLGATTIPQITAAMATALLPQTLWQTSTMSGKNLVLSPQFEDSTIPRDTSAVAGSSFGYSTTVARSGTQSYKVVTSNLTANNSNETFLLMPHTAMGGLSGVVSTGIKVQAGQWFNLEIYVRAGVGNTTTAGIIYWTMMLQDSSGANSITFVAPNGGSVNMSGLSTSTWTKVGGWAQVPAGYDTLWPMVALQSQNVANQTFYFDDARVAEDTQAQALTLQLFNNIAPPPGTNILSNLIANVIPGLDASKITSGQFAQSMLNITSIAAGIVSGVLGTGQIPGLDASKITGGQFAQTLVAGLPSLAATFSGTTVAGSNLVPDPSFENATVWPSNSNMGQGVAVRWPAGHTGSASMQLTGNQFFWLINDGTNTGQLSIPVNPGETYQMSAWVYTDTGWVVGGSGYQQLVGYLTDTSGTTGAAFAFAYSSNTVPLGVWTQISGVFTIPAGYNRMAPALWTNGVASGVHTYLDDVVLREVTQPQNIVKQLYGAIGNVASTITPGNVPILDASKITSGLFGIAQIPTTLLNKSNITDLGTTYTAVQNNTAVSAAMSRHATSAITVTAATGATPAPYVLSSYYDTADVTGTGISQNLPANSQISVSIAGWYRCDICFKVAGQFSAIWAIAPALYKNNTLFKVGHDAVSFASGGVGITHRWIHSSFQVQLAAGDYVQAGISAYNATGTISSVINGEATGKEAYFTVGLMNANVP